MFNTGCCPKSGKKRHDLSKSTITPRLEVKNITRCFDDLTVVKDVSLKLMPGQVTCLLGPSGCGKSTTLRLIAGLDRQNSGKIYVDDRLISGPSHHMPPEERSVGLMFQDFALFPHLNVADNVAFAISGSKSERRERACRLLDKVGLVRLVDQFPHSLSGGEQQRVALVRALASKPDIMLMDEPFSGLDNRLRDGIRDETLAILKEEGTAVLLVTHEPEEAMRMADEIALMRNGSIVQKGAPYNVYNTPIDRDTVAFFSDANTVKSHVHGALADTPFGQFLAPGHEDGTPVDIVFRPQHVRIDFDRQGKGPNPTVSQGVAALGFVERSRFLGSESLVEFKMDYDCTILKATVPYVFLPQPGRRLWLTIPRDRCYVFATP